MERLARANQERDINGLYLAIEEDPNILEQIDSTPFVDTPLHMAASTGHIEYAMEIIRLKPSFAGKLNQRGSTPIHVALEHNQTRMAFWLTNFDSVLVRVKGREGLTPLHYVVGSGEIDLLRGFLSNCPESIEDMTIRNETVFHLACNNSQLQTFELLLKNLENRELEANARILNTKDLNGNTVLHLAAAANQHQVIEWLLEWHKSNDRMLQIDATNENGQTAMDIAAANHHADIEHLLMMHPTQPRIYKSLSLSFRFKWTPMRLN